MRIIRAMLAVLVGVSGLWAVASSPAAAATTPELRIGDATMWEGDGGTATVSLPVDLSEAATTTVSVRYAIATDSATSADFVTRTGTLKFPAGATSKPLPVKIKGDTDVESDEHIAVTLSNAAGATLAKSTGGIWIMDDDADGVGLTPEVNVGSVSVTEADAGAHTAKIAVTLSRPAAVTVKVAYVLSCGSATAGSDYTAKRTGTLSYPPGIQSKDLVLKILADEKPEELIETVLDGLSVVAGPAIVSRSLGTGQIIDDDSGQQVGPLQPGDIRRISVPTETDGVIASCATGGTGADSIRETISNNGRYVALSTTVPLDPGDTNDIYDVYVHDLETASLERVSLRPDGSQFTDRPGWMAGALYASLSATGRYVTFSDGGVVYRRDRVAGTTVVVSVGWNGVVGAGSYSRVSADGRYVAFSSTVTTLDPVAAPANTLSVYLRDVDAGTTRRLVNWAPWQNQWGDEFAFTPDASLLAFNDNSSTRVAGDTNGCPDTFVMSVATGATDRVSVTSSGQQQVTGSYNDCSSRRPYITPDGRYVGFSSNAWNLYPGRTGPRSDGTVGHAYVRDRVLGTTSLIDTDSYTTDAQVLGISNDGRFAVHTCRCGATLPLYGPDQGTMWTDRATGETEVVGQRPDGVYPADDDRPGSFTYTFADGGISGDGTRVAFDSFASNLVDDDTNGSRDVFVQTLR